MANVDLDPAEIAHLRKIVKWRLGSLSVELDHTDSRDFKDYLKQQRSELEHIDEKLAALEG